MAPLLLSPEDAARVLGISRTSLFKLLREGRLPGVHVGRRRLIPAQALQKFVDDTVAGQATPAA
jgi:excisionase family DNA binding protein